MSLASLWHPLLLFRRRLTCGLAFIILFFFDVILAVFAIIGAEIARNACVSVFGGKVRHPDPTRVQSWKMFGLLKHSPTVLHFE